MIDMLNKTTMLLGVKRLTKQVQEKIDMGPRYQFRLHIQTVNEELLN